jgi:malonyl-CoA decarboxylase
MAQRSWREQVALAAEIGRSLLGRHLGGPPGPQTLREMSERLLKVRGEAIGLALAANLVDAIERLDKRESAAFLEILASKFSPHPEHVEAAIRHWHDHPDDESLRDLALAVEPPRQELFRRLNMVPGATLVLMKLRERLLDLLPQRPQMRGVDADFRHLFSSWFNRSILRLEQISWHTSADVLERLIEYEAVHEIHGWDDLRGRLAADRRCFAFFHPSLPGEPLIFVEIALTRGIPGSIGPLLDPNRGIGDPTRADCAIFYSISNCQGGLRGISFGNFLIKQVVQELSSELPQIKTFCTLSPLPNFAEHLSRRGDPEGFTAARLRSLIGDDADAIRKLGGDADVVTALDRVLSGPMPFPSSVDNVLRNLALAYLLKVRHDKRVADSVAHFHLSNGARLERINPGANLTENGRPSVGVMVNYVYEPDQLELNHENYVESRRLAVAPSMAAMAKRIDAAWAFADGDRRARLSPAAGVPGEA